MDVFIFEVVLLEHAIVICWQSWFFVWWIEWWPRRVLLTSVPYKHWLQHWTFNFYYWYLVSIYSHWSVCPHTDWSQSTFIIFTGLVGSSCIISHREQQPMHNQRKKVSKTQNLYEGEVCNTSKLHVFMSCIYFCSVCMAWQSIWWDLKLHIW